MTTPPAPAATVRAGTSPAPLPARTYRTRPGPATPQTSLVLRPLETAPRTARGVLKTSLAAWGLAHLTDDAEAITTELVTNAITASRTAAPPRTQPRPVILWIAAPGQELCIGIWDPDPTPTPLHHPHPGDNDEHGRGLIIVAALSSRWGSHPAHGGGKYTWATLPAGSGNGHA